MSLRSGSSPATLAVEAPGNHVSQGPGRLCRLSQTGPQFPHLHKQKGGVRTKERLCKRGVTGQGRVGLGRGPAGEHRLTPFLPQARQQSSRPGGGKTRVPASAPHPAPRVHLPGVLAPHPPPPSFPSSHQGHLRPRPVRALPQRLHSRPQAGTSTKVPAPAPHPGCGEDLGSPAPRGQLRCEARGPRNPGCWNPGMAGTTDLLPAAASCLP